MADRSRSIQRHSQSDTLADILERVLETGIVIAGDIRVNLNDVELLTVQIRLVICSVDKAEEMGMDWWKTASYLHPGQQGSGALDDGDSTQPGQPSHASPADPDRTAEVLASLDERLARLEKRLDEGPRSSGDRDDAPDGTEDA